LFGILSKEKINRKAVLEIWKKWRLINGQCGKEKGVKKRKRRKKRGKIKEKGREKERKKETGGYYYYKQKRGKGRTGGREERRRTGERRGVAPH